MDDRFADSARLGSCTLKLEGRPVSLEIRECKICLGGEFAGNVDLVLACDAGTAELLVRSLILRVPGHSDPLDVAGWGPASEGFEFTFGSMALADCGEVPESVTLFCDGHEVAVLPCRLWGSIPLDPSRFMDPAEILEGAAPPAMGSFETGFRYRPLLGPLGLVFAAGGIFLAGSTLWSQGFEPSVGLLGGGILAMAGLMLLVVMRVPYQEVRVDPALGTATETRARDFLWSTTVLEESQRDLREFSHLRIIERVDPAGSSDVGDTDIWFVSLEGPVQWENEYGDVHLRSDGLQLKKFLSDLSARRFAAEVAYSLGVRVLDTSESAS